jgi:hypothetical protein
MCFFRLFEQIAAHHYSVFSGCNNLLSENDNSAGDDMVTFFTVLGTNLTGVFLHVKSSGLVSVDCRKRGGQNFFRLLCTSSTEPKFVNV